MNDSIGTRERLIQEARRQFAESGFEGAGIRTITSAVDANLGAVTYHFGSKEKLYHEVLSSLWQPVLGKLQEARAREGTAVDRIDAVVRLLFAHMFANPDMAPIMLRELASSRTVPGPMQNIVRQMFSGLAALVIEGQAEKTIRPGTPALLVLSIIAQPFHVLAVRRKLGEVVGLDAQTAPVFSEVVENAVEFVSRGLAAGGVEDEN